MVRQVPFSRHFAFLAAKIVTSRLKGGEAYVYSESLSRASGD
jgi:hypothetical protein